VVDLDVELVVDAGARSRRDSVVVNAATWDIRHREQAHHPSCNRINEVAGRLGQLVGLAVQFGISGADISSEVICLSESEPSEHLAKVKYIHSLVSME